MQNGKNTASDNEKIIFDSEWFTPDHDSNING